MALILSVEGDRSSKNKTIEEKAEKFPIKCYRNFFPFFSFLLTFVHYFCRVWPLLTLFVVWLDTVQKDRGASMAHCPIR